MTTEPALPATKQMTLETWKRAHNLQVATLEEGAFIGRLEDFQFDLESHRIYGWRLKASGMFGRAGGVRADALKLVGRDLAYVTSESAVEWSGGRSAAVDGRSWASSYKGTQAITRRGRSLGAVQDFVIDRGGDHITGLLLHGGLLLPLDGRVQTGPAAIIVEDPQVVVELPEDENDEPTGWWERVTRAVGYGAKAQKPAIEDAIEIDDEEEEEEES